MTGTPVALDILIHPGVEFKPVQGDPLRADGNLGEEGPDLGIEAVAVNAEIEGGVPQPDEPGKQNRRVFALPHIGSTALEARGCPGTVPAFALARSAEGESLRKAAASVSVNDFMGHDSPGRDSAPADRAVGLSTMDSSARRADNLPRRAPGRTRHIR